MSKILEVSERKLFGVPVLFFALLIFCAMITSLIPLFGWKLFGVVLGAVVGLSVVVIAFTSYRLALMIFGAYGFLLFLIGDTLRLNLPMGVPFEILIGIIFIAILVKNKYSEIHEEDSNPFANAYGVTLLLFLGLDLILIVNSPLESFIPSIRSTFSLVMGYYCFYKGFKSKQFIKNFIVLILALSFFGALYGLRQEYVGLTDAEWQWLTSDPRRFQLFYIWGHVRKWSFFSDVNACGLTMAFTGIFSIVMAFGPFKTTNRIILVVMAIAMLLTMSYSGTRTATAMVPLGLAFYFLLTIDKTRTLLISAAVILIFGALIFGPFYGSTLNRIRSTFNSDDPSLNFREYKRKKLQSYVLSHPIGGGLGTANETAGRLSTTYDPDNGYLRTALDKGIPGLLVQLALFFVFMILATNAFYDMKFERNKAITAAFMASFFAITVAQFFQDAVEQKPINLLIFSGIAMVLRLKELDDKGEHI
ncbi:O-antigen ligase family protein [Fulvivirga sediminis]|uniref:O-antigen ligase family protein n=1 Tax=Fulvivirga sediminis TaxID=2803949 RepID=A0A937K2B0_9BACT|nr:O-antigen ligase family protein [Fulvivirga sediminis]MBL3658180.1 O-antigen ligase family protein [Fulvivirga sediminis]